MSKNRVEELESKVAELESTVTGLTEELVEAKDRIRDLEAELEPDPADGSQFPDPADRRAPEASGAPEAPARDEGGDPAGGRTEAEAAVDEAIEGTSPADEGDKSGATQEEDDASDSGLGDDIIVA